MASAPSVQEEPLQPEPGTERFSSQLAAAVRSISWSYAIFWSISTSHSGVVLAWNDGFYNGEIKTRKITNSPTELTSDQLVLQRSKQLRELYDALVSGECDHRARRPVTALSPEDLGDTEWYYVVCMTYVFRPGQGLPGKSFASNGSVWLCNAQSADRKFFSRSLLVKSTSIQTIVCFPLMGGVLELGTTDSVPEDPNLVKRIATSFWELQLSPAPAVPCSDEREPSSSTWPDEMAGDDILFEDLVGNAAEVMVPGGDQHEVVGNDDANLEQMTAMEIDELIYSLCGGEEKVLDDVFVRHLEADSSSCWLVDPAGFSDQLVPAAACNVVDGGAISHTSCFVAWKRSSDLDMEALTPVAGGASSQKLLKKAVDGGAWTSNGRGRAAILSRQESSIKSHVMSERRRREKLNEMFLILKSLVPSINKKR
ncbi:hypothetical protein GUJ93_ZPchr0001g30694 [Zizania palustris]|uniref:BHLH domain-containing protein n=1 Tax=Zizania palustris TaxID=103762 RepID=A0A8J5RPP1_ZIZPA|nr:hypothetical protein GUJ93_ZPchr0001g30694 [Zizania palustris]